MKGLHRHANLCSDLLYKGIKRSVFICLFVSTTNYTYAQTSKELLQASSLSSIDYEVQPLTIGDKVPDITFHNVLNYKSKTAKLSDFKGKLIILDFWSTYCSTCIAGFSKMEALQKSFNDKLQILLVNSNSPKVDSEGKIKTVLEKLKSRTGYYPSMPIAIHDTILNTYFPHESVPHQVWIDGNGKLIAVTGHREVNYANIKLILEGKNINLPVKNDWAFDPEKPLYFEGNGGDEQSFIYRSMFTGYNGSLGSREGGRWNEKGEFTGAYILNKSLISIVKEAYVEIFSEFDKSRQVLEVKQPGRFSEEFDPNNTYCYDLTIPATSIEQFNFKDLLKNELKRIFGISVRLEKRKIKCLLVKTSGKMIELFAKEDKEQVELGRKNVKKFIHYYPIGEVIRSLQPNFKMPLIDETNMTGQRIDLSFPENFDLSSTDALINFLGKNGFRFELAERLLDVVVISDLKN